MTLCYIYDKNGTKTTRGKSNMTLKEAMDLHLKTGSLTDTMAVFSSSEVLRMNSRIETVAQILKPDLPVVEMTSRDGDLTVLVDI